MRKPYVTEQLPGESMQHWYLRLAGAANKRLERLETLAKQDYYKPAMKWAYNRAAYDVRKWKQSGKVRFPEGVKWAETRNMQQLMGAISDVRTFIESGTSTKEGIKNIYQKRADVFNSEVAQIRPGGKKVGGFGTHFSWQTLAKYYETEWNKNWDRIFGSRTALRVIGVLQKNKNIISMHKKLSEIDVKDLRIEDSYLEEMVSQALKKKGLHIRDLIK